MFKPQHGILALLVVSVSALYGATLMVHVGNCVSEYCSDTSEFQVALAEWGTVHYTGYPLYMLLGSPFVSILRSVGVPPAAGGSLYSLFWQVMAVAGVFLLVHRETRNPWLSGATAFVLAVSRSMWVHGSIAEVYSLSMALMVWILWLTLELRDHWTDQAGWWLAFAGGLGVAHHRLLAVMLPVVGLVLLPTAWRSRRFWRWLGVACLCFAAGFLPYLDIPYRVWSGSTWLFNHADNWNDFWRVFSAAEVSYMMRPEYSLPSLLTAAQTVWSTLRNEMGAAGIIFSLIGAVIALVRVPRRAVLWWGVGLSYLAFTLIMINAVMVEADMMPLLLCLVAVSALGIAQLPRRWQIGASGLLLAGGLYLAVTQYPFVTALTHDTAGEQYIEQAEKLEAPPGSVMMALWGQQFFDLSYAKRVEGRLSQWQLVDHRADFKALTAQTDGRVYMSADTLNVFTVDQWQQRLGKPLRITSAGPGLLAVTPRPLPTPAGTLYPIGDGIALSNWEVHVGPGHTLDLVAYWVATRTVSSDYSTYVHVTDKPEIVTLDDLLGQSDSASPVYGWYPTSQWQPNEVVREDHVVALVPDRTPRTIMVGMYRHEADGQLTPLGHVVLDLEAGIWEMRASTPPG